MFRISDDITPPAVLGGVIVPFLTQSIQAISLGHREVCPGRLHSGPCAHSHLRAHPAGEWPPGRMPTRQGHLTPSWAPQPAGPTPVLLHRPPPGLLRLPTDHCRVDVWSERTCSGLTGRGPHIPSRQPALRLTDSVYPLNPRLAWLPAPMPLLMTPVVT